ncbi:hypothetical protein ACFSGX_16085 [Sphingomonas arantia]|uniref:DUF86 domain-containing protein n=1 Tax=Sphingomonas arantia TaxID=1460676 RepID=A0ABW4U3Z7_9SPHN
MTPEGEIAEDLRIGLTALVISLNETLDLTGPAPVDQPAFEALDKIQRVASTSLLKVIEQLEDQLARLFRTILQSRAVDTKGLYAADYGNHMERLGLLDDAGRWVGVVKLRNRLVHDYPIDPATQLSRLKQAHEAAPFLRETAERTLAFLNDRNLP